jgi:hypothetical protein
VSGQGPDSGQAACVGFAPAEDFSSLQLGSSYGRMKRNSVGMRLAHGAADHPLRVGCHPFPAGLCSHCCIWGPLHGTVRERFQLDKQFCQVVVCPLFRGLLRRCIFREAGHAGVSRPEKGPSRHHGKKGLLMIVRHHRGFVMDTSCNIPIMWRWNGLRLCFCEKVLPELIVHVCLVCVLPSSGSGAIPILTNKQ